MCSFGGLEVSLSGWVAEALGPSVLPYLPPALEVRVAGLGKGQRKKGDWRWSG